MPAELRGDPPCAAALTQFLPLERSRDSQRRHWRAGHRLSGSHRRVAICVRCSKRRMHGSHPNAQPCAAAGVLTAAIGTPATSRRLRSWWRLLLRGQHWGSCASADATAPPRLDHPAAAARRYVSAALAGRCVVWAPVPALGYHVSWLGCLLSAIGASGEPVQQNRFRCTRAAMAPLVAPHILARHAARDLHLL